MIKFIILLFLFFAICFADKEIKRPVRLDQTTEAWLAKDLDKSLNSLLENTQITSAGHIPLYNIGYLYFLKNDFVNALTYLQTAIVKEKSYPFSYLIISRIYKKSGNLLGAKTQLDRGLKYDSDNFALKFELADILRKLGEWEKAIKIYKELIDEDNNKVEPRVELAAIYRLQKKYEQAKKILENNNSLFPESKLLLEKANLYYATGENEKAKNILLEFYKSYPLLTELDEISDELKSNLNISQLPEIPAIPEYKYKFDPGEKLDYKVEYGFITLGWLKVRVEDAININGKTVYPVTFFVDSNPSFDFIISLHNIYESYIDARTLNAVQSRSYTPGSDKYLVRLYEFDYDNNIFSAQIVYADGRFGRVIKHLPNMAQDATSMLYFARGVVSNQTGGITTVVIDEEYKYGHIKFLNKTDELKIKGSKINATKIFARAEFEGVAGMNGDAWGWFSQDKNFTPLKGEIKIIVGSIAVIVDDEE